MEPPQLQPDCRAWCSRSRYRCRWHAGGHAGVLRRWSAGVHRGRMAASVAHFAPGQGNGPRPGPPPKATRHRLRWTQPGHRAAHARRRFSDARPQPGQNELSGARIGYAIGGWPRPRPDVLSPLALVIISRGSRVDDLEAISRGSVVVTAPGVDPGRARPHNRTICTRSEQPLKRRPSAPSRRSEIVRPNNNISLVTLCDGQDHQPSAIVGT